MILSKTWKLYILLISHSAGSFPGNMIIVPLSFKTPACVKDYINPTIQSVYSGYSFLILLFRFFYSDSFIQILLFRFFWLLCSPGSSVFCFNSSGNNIDDSGNRFNFSGNRIITSAGKRIAAKDSPCRHGSPFQSSVLLHSLQSVL